MSEVYRNTQQFVYLDIYGDVADAPPTAAVVKGTVSTPVTVQGPATVGAVQRWTAVVGFEHTQDVGELNVVWTFAINAVAAGKTDYLDVVVPLAEVSNIRDELEIPTSTTDTEIVKAERRARRVIESITGQVFAPVNTTLSATQLPDGSLRLPQRMIELTSVSGVALTLYYVLADGGWALAIVYPLKRDGIRASGVPITDPWAKYRHPQAQKVNVTGIWGYDRVPSDIYECALLLIEQYLCPESIYQERYLKTMTAADFRFELASPNAYRGTGNTIVDHILTKYTARSAAVI